MLKAALFKIFWKFGGVLPIYNTFEIFGKPIYFIENNDFVIGQYNKLLYGVEASNEISKIWLVIKDIEYLCSKEYRGQILQFINNAK